MKLFVQFLVLQAEKLGCEGKVEEAQGVLKLCDQLKEERTQLQEVVFLFIVMKNAVKLWLGADVCSNSQVAAGVNVIVSVEWYFI